MAEEAFEYQRLVAEVDPLTLRDELMAEAAVHFSRNQMKLGVIALAKLERATIDDTTIAKTDPFFPVIARGKRIIATCDYRRIPTDNEVVIIYGNYPHMFDNIVVNNPIKRHVATFGDLPYHKFEYDARWEGVERIYIINFDHRPDRYDAVLRELAAARAPLHRVTRIPAVRDQSTSIAQVDGQLGCLRSHINALRHDASHNSKHILLLEDDFCFTPEIDRHLDDLRDFVYRNYDYIVCLLATSKNGKIVPRDDIVSFSLQPCTNTAAYLVSGRGIAQLLETQEFALKRLLETHDTLKYSADRYWAVLQKTGKFLVFRRKFGFQSASFSDIEGQIARYLD
jgi:GR25 family glycosyltransferase involved in LPS biosynthesis